jgi:hypothetical protein
MALTKFSNTVAARYTSNAGQSFPDVTTTIVNFEDKEFDTHDSVTVGGSWKFTAPISGLYQVTTILSFNSVSATTSQVFDIDLYKNGSLYATLGEQPGTGATLYYRIGGGTLVKLNAGDYIDFRLYQNTGGSKALYAGGTHNYVSIHRVGD